MAFVLEVMPLVNALWKIVPAVIFLMTWQYFTTNGAWEKLCVPN